MHHPDGRPVVPEVSVDEAKRRVEEGSAVIVDVREPDEIAAFAVPDYIHIPLGDLPQKAASLPRDKDILFLCRSGNRSSYATAFALGSGFTGSANIAGGIIDWVNSGLPHRKGSGEQGK